MTERTLEQAAKDIDILIAQIHWLEGVLEESLDAEDAALIAQIRADWIDAHTTEQPATIVPGDVAMLAADCRSAAKVMANLNTFPTSQGILQDAADIIEAQAAELERLRLVWRDGAPPADIDVAWLLVETPDGDGCCCLEVFLACHDGEWWSNAADYKGESYDDCIIGNIIAWQPHYVPGPTRAALTHLTGGHGRAGEGPSRGGGA